MPAPLITTYSGVTPSRGLTGDAFNSAMSSWVAFMEAMPAEMNALFAVLNAGSGMGAVAIPYTFSTTTTDSDPGNGVLRLNQPTQNTATVIRADLLGSDAKTYTGVLDVFDVSDNAVRGYIRLVKSDDATKWLIFSVSALASPSGYKNITVANIGSSAASPFVNGDAITLYFTRSGNISAAPVNFARVTVASAATTADIWTPFGNQIDWTGTTTCTGFPAAPQAGVERVLICAGAAPFTAGANMLIDGVASGATVTCAANDIMIVRAVTTTQFRLSRVKYDGSAQVGNGLVLLSTVTASNSATVDVETGFGATYDDYIIIADGVRPATDSSNLQCQFKITGAYVATGTYYYHKNISAASVGTYSGVAQAAVAAIVISAALDNVNAASNLNFTMDIQNANTTSLAHSVAWRGSSLDLSGTLYEAAEGRGANSGTGALSGIRFAMSAGNISVGTFRLYGVTKS